MFALAAPREARAERWGCVTEHKEQKLQKHSPNFHHFCVGFPLLGLGLPRTTSCTGRLVPGQNEPGQGRALPSAPGMGIISPFNE